jgi:hypothetical protein
VPQPPVLRVTIDSDDSRSGAVVETLLSIDPSVEVRDARWDDDAAAFLDRLVCCGPVTPVVEVAGLLLTAPTPAEAVLAVHRAVQDTRSMIPIVPG